MARKDIQSRTDGVTRDMVPEEKGSREQTFRFPGLGEVKAVNYQEALKKVKKEAKKASNK